MTNYEVGYIDGAKAERKRIEKSIKALAEKGSVSLAELIEIVEGRK